MTLRNLRVACQKRRRRLGSHTILAFQYQTSWWQ